MRYLNACILVAGKFGDSYCLLKNRDRNYVPDVKIVHEIKDGVEIAYMYDNLTGWLEGMNEFGLGLVNTALMVSRDETEREEVERTGKPLGDGERIIKALTKKTVPEAVKIVKSDKDGLMGHTVISDGKKTVAVEMPHQEERAYEQDVDPDELFVRTNHGVHFPDAGYTSGVAEKSSKSRQQQAEKALKGVDDPDDITLTLVRNRHGDRYDRMNMVRDNAKPKKMRTTSQMLLNLTDKTLAFYTLPGKVKFKGIEDKLPKGYKPTLKIKVIDFIEGDDGMVGETKLVKTAERVSVASTRGVKFYHASPRRFRHGDVLTGGHSGGAEYCHDNVCMTTSPDPHITIRSNIPGWPGYRGHWDNRYPIDMKQTWYIYEVEPLYGPVYVSGNDEYQTRAAKVLRLVGTAAALLNKRDSDWLAIALPIDKERDRADKYKRRRQRRMNDDSDEDEMLKHADHDHGKSVALMKFLSGVARREGVAEHVYVVGGAVRNILINQPIKDIDVVVDSVALGGYGSEQFARAVMRAVPVDTNLATNQYGVAIISIKESWDLDGYDMSGEVIEIANARKESYSGAGGKGKGYKPTDVQPATIEEDIYRREFTFNTMLLRLLDVADGPDKSKVIDLTGLGQAHLKDRLIHTPLDPDRTFSDDPTRMLRAIKFLLKYGFKIPHDIAESIRRNAKKLADMPWEAVATILVRDILNHPESRRALVVMEGLGLIAALREVIQESKAFAAYLAGQLMGNKDVQLLLDLADLGISARTPVTFLTDSQRMRLRQITVGMDHEQAAEYLGLLKQPPIDNMALIEAFSIPARDRGILSETARRLMLDDPDIAWNLSRLQDAVSDVLRQAFSPVREASELERAWGAPISFVSEVRGEE